MLKTVVVITLATTFFDENKPKQLEFKVKEGGLEGRMGKKNISNSRRKFFGWSSYTQDLPPRDLDPQTKFDRQQTSRMACIVVNIQNIY